MKTAISLTVFAAGLLLAGSLLFAAADSPDAGKRIRELHKERVSVLTEFVALTVDRHNRDLASPEGIIEAKRMLLEAQRDAAETSAGRIKAQEGIVSLLQTQEIAMDTLYKQASGTMMGVYRAKADRLKAEIQLEELKSLSKPL